MTQTLPFKIADAIENFFDAKIAAVHEDISAVKRLKCQGIPISDSADRALILKFRRLESIKKELLEYLSK